MRNHFNIVRSTGILFSGLGVFLLGVTTPVVIERWQDTIQLGIWRDGLGAFLALGIMFLMAGFAGLFKSKWFPNIGMTTLALGIIAFSWLFFKILIDSVGGREFYLAVGLVIMVYIIFLSFILLLNNEYFLKALKEEDKNPDGNDQILDA